VDMSIDVDTSPDVGDISNDATRGKIVSFENTFNTTSSEDETKLGLSKDYRTPHRVEINAINKAVVKRRKDCAMAESTEMCLAEKQKKTNRNSNRERKRPKTKPAKLVVEERKAKHGVEIHEKLVRSYVSMGLVGEAMLRIGSPGRISNCAFKALKESYVSLVKLRVKRFHTIRDLIPSSMHASTTLTMETERAQNCRTTYEKQQQNS
jgi:hypothetical protein